MAMLGAIGYGYMYMLIKSEPNNNALNSIPRSAAFIIELNDTKKVFGKLSETNIMWEELMSTASFNKLNSQMIAIDSILQKNAFLADLLENTPLYASAHSTGNKQYEYLFTINLAKELDFLGIAKIIQEKGIKTNLISSKSFNGIEVKTIKFESRPFSYAIVKELLVCSYSITLVEDAIKQTLTGSSIAENSLFKKIHKTAGRKTDANIYINFQHFFKLFNPYLEPGAYENVASLSDFAEWSESDVRIRPNSLTLNGFTTFNDSLGSYLSLFKGQEQQLVEFTRIVPSSTSSFIFFGISNFDVFYGKYKNYLKHEEKLGYHTNVINAINSLYEIDIENSLLSWIGNEMALIYTEPRNSNLKKNTYAVFKTDNIDHVNKSLDSLVASLSQYHSKKVETEFYRYFDIVNINIPYIIPNLLGGMFRGLDKSYFIIIDQYVVFGNSNASLKEFINRYLSEKTLSRDINYVNFAEKLSSESSIYLYSNIARSSNIYKTFLNDENSNQVTENLELFQKFGAFGYQINSTDIENTFYNNIYLNYNPVYKKVNASMWEAELDTSIKNKPAILVNHYTHNKEVFVQDELNNVYLISPTGKILFKRALEEEIMGKTTQIDLYKNGKLQMLFNTKSKIYLIDRKGNDVGNYPIKLKSNATNELAIFDYDKKRDYRILIACENKSIYNYTGKGKIVKGWEFKKSKAPIKVPISHFSIKRKDYIVAIDSIGKVYVINRKGKSRVKMKVNTNANITNYTLDIGRDINSSKIITTDTIGNISKLSFNSKEETILIESFSAEHHFAYCDLNNDKSAEFIFIDHSILSVFDQEGTLLFNHVFETEITSPPLLFNFPNKEVKIGVVADQSNEIYLFNSNGTIAEGFPLYGSKVFSIADINNNGNLNLVTGNGDRNIYTFALE